MGDLRQTKTDTNKNKKQRDFIIEFDYGKHTSRLDLTTLKRVHAHTHTHTSTVDRAVDKQEPCK